MKALGLKVIVWNRDTFDCKIELLNTGTKKSKSNQLSNLTLSQDAFKKWLLEPEIGTISLQHDINNFTVLEIPPTLDLLKNSSYSPVLVSQCANITVLYDDGIIEKLGAITETAIKVDQVDDGNSESNASPRTVNGNVATSQTSNVNIFSQTTVIIAVILILLIN